MKNYIQDITQSMDTSAEDPDQTLRTDLWPTMVLLDLYKQREIMTNKISRMLGVLEKASTPSAYIIYQQLTQAEKFLNSLIEMKESGEYNDKRLHSKKHQTFK